MESRGSSGVAGRFRAIADDSEEQAKVVDAALRLVAVNSENGRLPHELPD
jgi:hypothetical protein